MNADLIRAGILNADLIRAGVLSAITIQNADGSLQIDLSGSNGIVTKRNGKNAIELAGTVLKFYDWDGGDVVGQMYSSRVNGNEKMPGIVIANKKDSYLALGYEQNGQFYSYIKCDKDNIDNNTQTPITIFQEAEFKGKEFWFGHDINSIYNSTDNNLTLKVKNRLAVKDADTSTNRLYLNRDSLELWNTNDNNRYCNISPSETFFGNAGKKYFSCRTNSLDLWNTNDSNRYCNISPSETFFGSAGQKYFSCRPNGFSFWKGTDDIFYTTTIDTIQSDRGFHINGNFTVNGNKNCVQSTENYGDVLFYSVEDCESYLTDRSMELFTVEETDSNTYERVILLDNVFKESINLDFNYTVEIIKQGWGDYRIKEQTKDYFIVESDRKDFTFKYVITGKRKGYENERNNPFYKGAKSIDLNYDALSNDISSHIKEDEE